MYIFKTKLFAKWADKEGLTDTALWDAVAEMERGLIDADLGGHVVKKRVAIGGRGKSSGLRTILAYQIGDRAFFVYGFAKNQKANITKKELKALQALASEYLNYQRSDLMKAVECKALIEVCQNG